MKLLLFCDVHGNVIDLTNWFIAEAIAFQFQSFFSWIRSAWSYGFNGFNKEIKKFLSVPILLKGSYGTR